MSYVRLRHRLNRDYHGARQNRNLHKGGEACGWLESCWWGTEGNLVSSQFCQSQGPSKAERSRVQRLIIRSPLASRQWCNTLVRYRPERLRPVVGATHVFLRQIGNDSKPHKVAQTPLSFPPTTLSPFSHIFTRSQVLDYLVATTPSFTMTVPNGTAPSKVLSLTARESPALFLPIVLGQDLPLHLRVCW